MRPAYCRNEQARRRKLLLIISLVTNLGILGFFKYFNFFVDSAIDSFAAIGISANRPVLNVILPVGISFYTFQTLSYTIDIYRGKFRPCGDFITFALFVSYFPQLVAGPIERASRLLPQLQKKRRVTGSDIQEGAFLIFLGIFKKVGISDAVASTVDLVFAYPDNFSGTTLLLGLYFFSLQIYCDFSGYSDIARGTSKLLGVDLMVNFNQPYFSRSVTEFWHRWHISLSTWLRDYLYIPLGGNRRGRAKMYRNLMVTMLLGGLWHGAAWTFIVWGLLHGTYLAVHKAVTERRPARAPQEGFSPWGGLVAAVKVLGTFHLVALTWIFFRSDTFTIAWQYLSGIVLWQNGESWIGEFEIARLACALCVLLTIEIMQAITNSHLSLLKTRWQVRGTVYGVMLVALIVCGGLNADVPFIYFQF